MPKYHYYKLIEWFKAAIVVILILIAFGAIGWMLRFETTHDIYPIGNSLSEWCVEKKDQIPSKCKN